MKNIIVIQGGGRPKGNTAQLIEAFVKGAEGAGHNVAVISLIKNEVKGCLGCNPAAMVSHAFKRTALMRLLLKLKMPIYWYLHHPYISGPYHPELKRLLKDFIVLLRKIPTRR